MTKLTKGIRAKVLLCTNKLGIEKKYSGRLCYLSMTGRGPNLPVCKKFDNSRWVSNE